MKVRLEESEVNKNLHLFMQCNILKICFVSLSRATIGIRGRRRLRSGRRSVRRVVIVTQAFQPVNRLKHRLESLCHTPKRREIVMIGAFFKQSFEFKIEANAPPAPHEPTGRLRNRRHENGRRFLPPQYWHIPPQGRAKLTCFPLPAECGGAWPLFLR